MGDKELGCGDDGGDGGDGSDGSDGGDGDLGFELVSEESTGVATSCPHLGGGNVNGGLEGCKKLCIDTNGCNAFNYKNNVCYTKKCADCDIKPYTTHGGWNVWMDKELGCGDDGGDGSDGSDGSDGGDGDLGFELVSE